MKMGRMMKGIADVISTRSYEIAASLADHLLKISEIAVKSPLPHQYPSEPLLIIMAKISDSQCKDIYEWVIETFHDIPKRDLVHPKDYHITIICSRAPLRIEYPIQSSVSAPATVTNIDALGPSQDTLVLRVKSSWLNWRYKIARMCGATSDFPSYKPHITIAKNTRVWSPVHFMPFPITIVGETIDNFR